MNKLDKLIKMYEAVNGVIDRKYYSSIGAYDLEEHTHLIFYKLNDNQVEKQVLAVSQSDILFDYIALSLELSK